eukprot:10300660-Heterocapsa_arctica.AAC.1
MGIDVYILFVLAKLSSMNASSASSLLGVIMISLAFCLRGDVRGYINMERNGRQHDTSVICFFTARSDDSIAGALSS